MSTIGQTQVDTTDKIPRWQFRKKKKLEKRRKKRQQDAEKHKPTTISTTTIDPEAPLPETERLKYEQDKRNWEDREVKFKLVELAKQKAREKEQRAKALTQKRWQDTLMTLPMLPPTFSINSNYKTTTPFKTFVQPSNAAANPTSYRKTYRDKFLEKKLSKP